MTLPCSVGSKLVAKFEEAWGIWLWACASAALLSSSTTPSAILQQNSFFVLRSARELVPLDPKWNQWLFISPEDCSVFFCHLLPRSMKYMSCHHYSSIRLTLVAPHRLQLSVLVLLLAARNELWVTKRAAHRAPGCLVRAAAPLGSAGMAAWAGPGGGHQGCVLNSYKKHLSSQSELLHVVPSISLTSSLGVSKHYLWQTGNWS